MEKATQIRDRDKPKTVQAEKQRILPKHCEGKHLQAKFTSPN